MKKRILCVDDEFGVQEILTKLITSWGYEIQCASGMDSAIELFEAMRPFLVITDLRLQNHVDGVTLADRLHRTFDPLCIFIAISGWVSSFDLGYLVGSAVFTDVLQKPVDPKVLEKVIAYAWDKRQRWERLLE